MPDPEAAFAWAIGAGVTSAMEIMVQDDGSRMDGVADPFGTL